jgi:hypothetical protein
MTIITATIRRIIIRAQVAGDYQRRLVGRDFLNRE